jgi:hypothetical protein
MTGQEYTQDSADNYQPAPEHTQGLIDKSQRTTPALSVENVDTSCSAEALHANPPSAPADMTPAQLAAFLRIKLLDGK